MGCLYYIPSRRFENGVVPDTLKDDLAAYGLGHLDGARLAFRGVRNGGPDGGQGLCIGMGLPISKVGMFAGAQEWRACEGGDLWFGWPKESGAPGPELFRRADLLDAKHSCVLGDGNAWEFSPCSALPKVLSYDSAGELCRLPRASDALHFEASDWLFDFLCEGTKETTFAEIYRQLTICLAARYHVSMVEAVALGLWHDDTYHRAILSALGVDSKKNDGATG